MAEINEKIKFPNQQLALDFRVNFLFLWNRFDE